jgi:hypothetical protein
MSDGPHGAATDGRYDFGWHGVRLRVPEEWELGRVDGDAKSGYARLDDAQMVRAEVEWRAPPERGLRRPVEDLVDRYIDNLRKKADKAGMDFSVERRAKFLKDKRWLEGTEYETFLWEADYRAYNLARACPDCGRVVLLRVLARRGEDEEQLVNDVLPTLEDHPRHEATYWSLYGLTFHVPPGFELTESDLKSGHVKLTFEKDGGAHTLRVHRLSMAHMLLRKTGIADWYPTFFRKDLRDVNHVLEDATPRGHEGLRVVGRPHSRWRQILRPLPFINPRPRRYLDGAVWHCPEQNRICVVEHLYRKRDAGGEVTDEVIDGYVCHEEQAATDARGDAGLAAGAQRAAGVGEDRGG